VNELHDSMVYLSSPDGGRLESNRERVVDILKIGRAWGFITWYISFCTNVLFVLGI
jgi:hypothetical protein